MIDPFGLAMPIDRAVTRLFMTCTVMIVQKGTVLPLLAIANKSVGMIVGGGTYSCGDIKTNLIIEIVRSVNRTTTRNCIIKCG